MTRPRIGITSPFDWVTHKNMHESEVSRHAKLLESLGAEPVILPRGDATAHALHENSIHGLLFSGGGDVESTVYGGNPELANDRIDRVRDNGELSLIREAFARRIPTLCVCRGMQLANAAFGGSLIEDLRTELGIRYTVPHHQLRDCGKNAEERSHRVYIEARSTLKRIVHESEIWTNSMHHQGIRVLAPLFRKAAHAADDTVEALELAAPDFFFLAVQWHPEWLSLEESSARLYEALIEAASTTKTRSNAQNSPVGDRGESHL